MPWNAKSTMQLRQEFVSLARQEGMTMAELCRRFGISRQTGYKWLARHVEQGDSGLADQPRRPANSPSLTPSAIEQEVVQLRRAHPAWGGRKISRRLADLGVQAVPAPSTVTSILHRHGLISPQASDNATAWQRFEHAEPNALWQIDFKGHFETLRQGRCSPLTVLDDHSRYNVLLHACGATDTGTVQACLRQAFERYGLPVRINADNGAPWGSPREPGQVSELAIWLIRLGIRVSYSRPHHPQTNGKDERFHRSLKAEVLNGRSFHDFAQVQAELERWRVIYNQQRPHEALGLATPITRYRPSARRLPNTLPPLEYGPDDTVLRVQSNGRIRFKGRRLRVSKALYKLDIAARARADADDIYEFYLAHHRLMTLDLNQPETTP
jgi:transposase InsO family protein